ncbi:uncharacterized protein Z520_04441 [Fonsecaea multimorphosa CBS 102226]|uniref:Kinesin-like protein n=1 Tax=Fonsecaea multimorphosa CBS 102226 TaxID=1442371 RepID=A0A0D2HD48_9EURO|nr:uncharacterized protein Z520_04441 [Fonsecaea multimorphosa CBS 102226]KIX99805.1 hypothetical protein Z520_04441 [Fonsecaea multimorphosa CBS 102226]OAL26528.1 hypothetical protein AYO22_04203 [Fonsecaea multimorphosa]
MDNSTKMAPQTSLFQVYLRLRPPFQFPQSKQKPEPWLIVEPPNSPAERDENPGNPFSSHITLQPPNDSRKRAIERFGFTKIFQEEATQLDIFDETGVADTIKSVLQTGRDGLVATLGVTGSGKSHTILGSKSQRGLTQMTLDVLFKSIGEHIRRPHHPDLPTDTSLLSSLQGSDPTEAQIWSATTFLESIYSDGDRARLSRAQTPMSRAQTPMMVGIDRNGLPSSFPVPPRTSTNTSTVENPCPLALIPDHFTGGALSTVPMLSSTSSTVPFPEKEPWRPPSKLPFLNRLKSLKKSPAKSMVVKESLGHPVRRPPLPRPSTFPQSPDTGAFTVDIEQQAEYVVLVSMYEVYNDRIFDLLSNPTSPNAPPTSTRQGAALQKGLLRRPLLFKNTEMSPDMKVVAGLRKVVCGSYDEAMMVLETGLTERRVAGTGSNSVSSRSHGFFCIEVKKRSRPNYNGGYLMACQSPWAGGTMTICDLAGSERARNAKTTGSTLAEAGKINESLMYLGQCLQVINDCQQEGSKPIVPFRQCKLTELLFSNSFPSSNHAATCRPPQKGVMIVTADPLGDFNATSQILRYAAMAREVTVPRVPSVTSTILGATQSKVLQTGRCTPHDGANSYFITKELEQATHEATRLAEECNFLAVKLAEEEIQRTEAELKLQAAEEKLAVMEQEVREECWTEMEERLDEEKERWRAAWEQEKLRGEAYVDGKLEILEKTAKITIHEDAPGDGRIEELERENESLRAKLRALQQEIQTKSPTKKPRGTTASKSPIKGLVLQESSNANIATNPFLASLRASTKDRDSEATLKPRKSDDGLDICDVSPRKLSLRSSSVTRVSVLEDSQSPAPVVKKQRKLTTRKWDLGDPDEI